MPQSKRSRKYSKRCTSPAEPIHRGEDSESLYRIIKRELLPTHRAQPFLVENLLLADKVGIRTHSTAAPSIESILQVLQFSKRMKWLCEWGPEIVDESLRPPSATLPTCIDQKSKDQRLARQKPLTDDEFLALLSDSSQQWDRIILSEYESAYFALLHLHPCQELWLDFFECELSLEDMENIAKCTNLRIFGMGLNQAPFQGVLALRSLPNLRQVVYDETAHPLPCIEALSELPQVTLIAIRPMMNEDDFHRYTTPFSLSEIDKALAYIRDRWHTARQIRLSVSIGPLVFVSLCLCTHLTTICIEDVEMMEENDLSLLFEGPALHKTVRHIRLWSAGICPETASYLALYTNLLWLDFSSFDATADAIVPVILANAKHLQSLRIAYCNNVGDEILDAIAQCKSLQHVCLYNTGVRPEAYEAYRDGKRPNWEVLTFHKREPRARLEGIDTDLSSDDMEESYEDIQGDSDSQ